MPLWADEAESVELDQKNLDYVPKLEQRVAETKSETNKYKKIVAIEMKKWLDNDGVIDLASIKTKRREFEDYARIIKIDDQADLELLDNEYKMDKFVKLTVPIMRHQLGLLLPVAAAADPTLDEIAPDIRMVAAVAAAVLLCQTNNDSRSQVAAMAPDIWTAAAAVWLCWTKNDSCAQVAAMTPALSRHHLIFCAGIYHDVCKE